MKKLKKYMIVGSIILVSISLYGCESRTEEVNKSMSIEDIERLPEDQKETELDKTLTELRKFRRDNSKTENGSSITRTYNGSFVPGYIENPNKYSREESEAAYKLAYDYIINDLKLPKRGSYEYDLALTMDPRINKVFVDEDKGVLNGYSNNNIFIVEYETKEDSVYSYLFLARESQDSPWQIIHDGITYKID